MMHVISGFTNPAPTWPVRARLPAMPVLITGRESGPGHKCSVDTG